MASSDLLQELLGDFTEHGPEKSFNCPFCVNTGRTPDRDEKLWVNEEKRKFLCYRCETKGPLEYLFLRLGAEEEESAVRMASGLSGRIRKLNGLPVEEPEFSPGDEEEPVMNYLEEITRNGCVPIMIGSASWNYLRDRGLSDDDIEYYDLVDGRGRYRNRVIVPTFDHEGNLTYFVSRAYRPIRIKIGEGEYKDAPKYLNPRGEGRRHSVFNLARAAEFDTIVITEGVFSAMAAGRNAVATYGKLVTATQIELLASYGAGKELIVCLDGDAHDQTVDVARRLHDLRMNVSIAVLPVEHDPDSIGTDRFTEILSQRVEYSPLSVAKLQASGDLRRKKARVQPTSNYSLDSIRKKLVGS